MGEECWCGSADVRNLTLKAIQTHLRGMTFDELVAHGPTFEDYCEWCRVRGITRDLRPYGRQNMMLFRSYRPVLLQAYYGLTSTVLHIPHIVNPYEDILTATMTVTKMRLNYVWKSFVLPEWETFCDEFPDQTFPLELLRLIVQFVGWFGPVDIDTWRSLNQKKSFATDIHEYLNYYHGESKPR